MLFFVKKSPENHERKLIFRLLFAFSFKVISNNEGEMMYNCLHVKLYSCRNFIFKLFKYPRKDEGAFNERGELTIHEHKMMTNWCYRQLS